ncbi:DUF547 domain-containing protein [bacterium]|nr:DUF547 domain-containing protein [bacterium]
MHRRRIPVHLIFLLSAFVIPLLQPAVSLAQESGGWDSVSDRSGAPDHTDFDMLCGLLVDAQGNVRYEGFRVPAFERYVAELGSVQLEQLGEDAQLATALNAYNAFVILNVIRHWPLASVMDVPNFFDEQRFLFGGRMRSLREIEDAILRPLAPVLSHFATCSAAKSSPRLTRHAYAAGDVREQLRRQARRYFADTASVRLDREEGVLYLSMIFRWFRKDFTTVYGSLRQLALRYLPQDDAQWFAAHEAEIRYMPWDWSLNSR